MNWNAVRIAEDLHDDLGGNLGKIALLGELTEADSNYPGKVQNLGREISGAARESTQALEEIVWAATPEHDNLEGLVDYASHCFRTHLQAAGISFRLDAPQQPIMVPLTATDRHSLFLALKEALHNIVKHSGASEVLLGFQLESNYLIIQVQDNGHGFTSSETINQGDGLKNMRQRMERLGGAFNLQSRPGAGTIIRFTLLFGPIPKRNI